MSFEYKEPLQNPNPNNPRTKSELWGEQWKLNDEDTQPQSAVSPPAAPVAAREQQSANPQIPYREHVTGSLPAHPSDAPLFRPAYIPYPPPQQQGYGRSPQAPGYPPPQQGYAPYPVPGYPSQGVPLYQGYPGYPAYAPYGIYPGYNVYPPYYAWQPPQPKKDGFHLAVSIISLLGSILVLLAGLACVLLLMLFLIGASVSPASRAIRGDQYFSALLTLTAFSLAGIVGGSFSAYHSIRALLRKPSASFVLPWFWVFLIPYLFVVGIGYALYVNKLEVTSPPLTVFLIILAAIFPALTLAALGVRRLRFPEWTTTWRRFKLALTSGATLAIGMALVLELGFLILLVRGQGAVDFQKCIDNPNQPGCGSFATFNLIFIIVAIVGPVVEETVKPLAVAFFIGRVRSASEAFVLGMAAGIGFALVETVGYIGAGYHDWLTVALERTGASLLHGFGAAMVALGWYYLINSEERRIVKAFAFWAYAVFQHFVWNGTAVLSLLPGPVGSSINSWNLNLGFVTLPFTEILSIIEAILILVFFMYMTGKLRRDTPTPSPGERKVEASREPQLAAHVAPLHS